MSGSDELRYAWEEVRVFYRNLKKDPLERRQDKEKTAKYVSKLNRIRTEVETLKLKFNSEAHEQKVISEAKEYANSISKYITSIDLILETRLSESRTEQPENLKESGNSSSTNTTVSVCSEENTMAEKFDLKTAASLLPVMDGHESTTKQLIDAVKLYCDLLDDNGKKSLITYVLKTRISQNAKIRLKSSYTTCDALISDLKAHFITKQSASALSFQMNNSRQGSRSIEEFGKNIEELLMNLTISQADDDADSLPILSKVNEKLAITAFANGLQNHELRTIIKARNYLKLGEAIRGAKDEELNTRRQDTHQVFHFRRGNHRSQNRNRGSIRNRGSHTGFQRSNYNSNFRQNQNFRGQNNRGRSMYSGRRNFHNHVNNGNRAYYMQNSDERDENSDVNHNQNRFFRA